MPLEKFETMDPMPVVTASTAKVTLPPEEEEKEEEEEEVVTAAATAAVTTAVTAAPASVEMDDLDDEVPC